jgi:DNA-binding NarL/FixJ family response regulator
MIRILCVDDHVVVLAGLTAIVQHEADMEVVACATNGPEAIEQFQRHKPDITLMDLQMPGMSGFQTIREILACQANARIVVLTMFQGNEDVYRALTLGASAYLLKDTLADNLIRVVREVHEKRGATIVAAAQRLARLGNVPSVTPREVQVLELVAKGMRNKEIGQTLGVAEETIQAHMKSIFAKLDVHDRTAALALALRRGIVHLDNVP